MLERISIGLLVYLQRHGAVCQQLLSQSPLEMRLAYDVCLKVLTHGPIFDAGMGSLKVTFFLISEFSFGVLLKISFIFDNTSISSFPRAFIRCRRAEERSPIALTMWSSGDIIGWVR
jgi:hypothetical protein